jgi:hypothetical protein
MLYHGLEVEGSVSYDPGERRTWWSGGSPGGWEVEIESVEMVDWDEFCKAFYPSDHYSDGTIRLLENWHRWSKGRILPTLKARILRVWGEDFRDALIAEYTRPRRSPLVLDF